MPGSSSDEVPRLVRKCSQPHFEPLARPLSESGPMPAPGSKPLHGGTTTIIVGATPSRRSDFFYRSRRRRPSASSSTVSSTPTFFSSTRSRASHCSGDVSIRNLTNNPAIVMTACASIQAADSVTASPPASPPPHGCCPFLRKPGGRTRRRSATGATVSVDAPSASSTCATGPSSTIRLEDWSPVERRATAWHSLLDFSAVPTRRPPAAASSVAPSVARSGSSSTSGSHLGLGRHADHQDFALIDMRPPMPPLPPRQRHHSMGAAAPSRPPPPSRALPAPRLPARQPASTVVAAVVSSPPPPRRCLVRCLAQVYACPYYWGRMDSRHAETLLRRHASGTYLLRDSTHEQYLFTVSYSWDEVIKHIRMEHVQGRFSLMDRLDFASPVDLIEYYRNAQQLAAAAAAAAGLVGPQSAEDVGKLLKPLVRPGVFPLASLCRGVICANIKSYASLEQLHLPPTLVNYLRHYSYDVIP